MNENFIQISHTDISEEALLGVIRNHLLKLTSSDSVFSEMEMDKKITRIKSEVIGGKTFLVFDKANEEVIVCSKSDFQEFKNKQQKSSPIWHGALPPEDSLPF